MCASGARLRAMRSTIRGSLIVLFAGFILIGPALASAQTPQPTEYRLSFSERAHHVMQVEVTFHGVPAGPLQVRMSRSSPGRYAAHDFAKNVFDEHITDGHGKTLTATRPNPHEWDITGHDGTVHITYQLYGNRADGTYLGVDTTHAHMNMPAMVMWARGFDDRAVRLTFVQPPDSNWKIATQLYPTGDPFTFTAPNLQYLMDSPTEFGTFALRTFTVPPRNDGGRNGAARSTGSAGAGSAGTAGTAGSAARPGNPASPGSSAKAQTLRVAMHHLGTDAELDVYTADVEKIVREEQAIFGELPDFEPGYYTFLVDYTPWSDGDGMEHRNSTSISAPASLAAEGKRLVGTASHEFFHCWNVERIRPASLEPFNFEDANISGELWLAEGFTNYYGKLALLRAGINDPIEGVSGWAGVINGLMLSPGTKFRSAVDMSRLAPFVDAATSIDPTYWQNAFYSYYPFGEAIALGLDLTLRVRSDSKLTLDDFMRAMWRAHGKPGGPQPGLVGKPYTIADARARLGEVTGDKAFADDFFRRYVEGTERMDYAALLQHAGFTVRKQNAGKATLGSLRLEPQGDGQHVLAATTVGSPAYSAGLDQDDDLLSVAGVKLTSPDDVTRILSDHKPGDEVELVFKRRDGKEVRARVPLAQDLRLEVVPVERAGGTLTTAQKRFRDDWLGSKASK
jgi:predicted metalloprotease with PDZ domain